MPTLEEFQALDAQYPSYADEFAIPTFKTMDIETSNDSDKEIIYFCGNSLGLMPKSTRKAINDELDAWAYRGVESHFRHHGAKTEGKTSWVDIDLPLVPLLAPIVGAKESEVAVMGSLTSNLNALMVAFYQPKDRKRKILFEKGSFPSDYYAIYNQIRLKNLDPEDCILQLSPRDKEYYLRTEDILQTITEQHEEIALVMLPGIQYYTGQLFDIEQITKHAKQFNIVVGWDLAHAAGNAPLELHSWDVDFATWCSYKYFNSGPGGISGIFVHEKHNQGSTEDEGFVPRLAGWWGNNSQRRFQMLENFEPIPSALGFRQSNPSVIDVVSLGSSLKIFQKAGIKNLREKSVKLTNYLETLLLASKYYIPVDQSFAETGRNGFTILTPNAPEERGAQLSLLLIPQTTSEKEGIMEEVNGYLHSNGIVCDERRPDVIRVAPVPLYNTFEQVWRFVQLLNEAFEKVSK
ncbi:hypothetical protein WICPIJ_006609 [Wickerhamomyces pijperi]|uniref:Kynureninase n=1 Tax=Wickerhamomyces pijperi TaxID=599730 RepID=A0A9P8Q1D3_WICPI|nr:hypothetical protein WICPIJ_006609 [Wickerhamomyces pijperi]